MSEVKLCLKLCSRSQPGIKVIIRDLRGHLLHTVTFVVLLYNNFAMQYILLQSEYDGKRQTDVNKNSKLCPCYRRDLLCKLACCFRLKKS